MDGFITEPHQDKERYRLTARVYPRERAELYNINNARSLNSGISVLTSTAAEASNTKSLSSLPF